MKAFIKNKDSKHRQALEDKLWANKAQKAERAGFLTAKESEVFFKK